MSHYWRSPTERRAIDATTDIIYGARQETYDYIMSIAQTARDSGMSEAYVRDVVDDGRSAILANRSVIQLRVTLDRLDAVSADPNLTAIDRREAARTAGQDIIRISRELTSHLNNATDSLTPEEKRFFMEEFFYQNGLIPKQTGVGLVYDLNINMHQVNYVDSYEQSPYVVPKPSALLPGNGF